MLCATIGVTMVDAMAKSLFHRDENLVLRGRSDASALGALYEKYYPGIYRFCVRRLYCRDAAEDVTSSVFLAVARKMPGFCGETEVEFRNWLYAIAANHANSYIRKNLRRRRLLEKEASNLVKNSEDNRESPDWPKVYAAIGKLAPDTQTIITLRYFERLSFEQIAEIVDKKPSSVRVIAHRGIKALRKYLKTVSRGDYDG